MANNLLRTVVGVCILELLLAGGWWYVHTRISHARAEAIQLAHVVSAAEAKQNAVRALSAVLQDTEKDRVKIDGAFASSTSLVRFIEDLENTAALAGVELTIQSASLPQSADGFPSFGLSVSGSFNGVYRFIALIETMPYYIAFDTIRITKSGGKTPWSANIDFQLKSFLHS